MTSQKSRKEYLEHKVCYCPTCKTERQFKLLAYDTHKRHYSCEECGQGVIKDYLSNKSVQEFYRKWRKEEEGR